MRISENGSKCVIRVNPVKPSRTPNSPQTAQSSDNICKRPMTYFALSTWYSKTRSSTTNYAERTPRLHSRAKRGGCRYKVQEQDAQTRRPGHAIWKILYRKSTNESLMSAP
jgi:hypothetical protein